VTSARQAAFESEILPDRHSRDFRTSVCQILEVYRSWNLYISND